jgi:DNA-binding transcriptional regulator YiaG
LIFLGVRNLPTGLEIKAARTLLRLKQEQLARLARVDQSTLVRWERQTKVPPSRTEGFTRTVAELEKRGIEFIPGGVRLIKKPR